MILGMKYYQNNIDNYLQLEVQLLLDLRRPLYDNLSDSLHGRQGWLWDYLRDRLLWKLKATIGHKT